MTDYLRKLAEATDKDGLPLIPGLRKSCPQPLAYMIEGEHKDTRYYPEPQTCENCNGKGWVLVPGAEALAVMLEFAIERWQVRFYKIVGVQILGKDDTESAYSENKDALAETLCRVVKLI